MRIARALLRGLVVALLCSAFGAANAAAPAKPDLSRVASLIAAHVNDYRRSEGRQDVAQDARLRDAARQLAEFMAKTGKFDHRADGKQPWDRAQQHGYQYCLISENIAYEYNSKGFGTAELARKLFDGWKGSPGHRKNMGAIGPGHRHRDRARRHGPLLRGANVRPAAWEVLARPVRASRA
jgi:uncharacterized protein YkwD